MYGSDIVLTALEKSANCRLAGGKQVGRVRHGAGHQAPASLNQVWPWPFKPWYPSEMATAAPPQRHHAGSVKVTSARNSDDPRWSAALSVQCHDRGHDASRHGGRRFLVRTAAQWCSRGDHSRGERSQGRGCVARSAHSALTPPSLLPSPALSSPLLPLTCSLLP